MDILISSNLQRLLLAITQEDSEVRKYMEQLKETGRYEVSERVRDKIQKLFMGYCCDDAETQKVIGAIYKKFDYLIDPHTAVGFSALEQYRKETGDETPAIGASTASPFKFCDSVLEALGEKEIAPGLDALDQLAEKTGVEMPICRCVYEILYRQRPVQEVARELMGRARKGEIEDGWRYPVG